MAKVKFNMPNVGKTLEKYDVAKDDLDDVARQCVAAAQGIQYAAMRAGLARHKDTGDAINSLEKKPIKRDANRTYTDTGIALKGGNDGAFWGALAQEYGTPHFPKDPWMRPAIDESQAEIKAAWKKIMARRGYPMK